MGTHGHHSQSVSQSESESSRTSMWPQTFGPGKPGSLRTAKDEWVGGQQTPSSELKPNHLQAAKSVNV